MSGLGLADTVTAAVAESSRSFDATGGSLVDVPPSSWREAAEAIAAAGGQLDWLTGVDLGRSVAQGVGAQGVGAQGVGAQGVGAIAVVAMFIRGDEDAESAIVRTEVGYSETLPTVSDLFASAAWHERETTEMLGVTFVGGDPRRLLLPREVDGHPLRRDYPLTVRLQTPWPGAEPGRRARVPGLNLEWQP